MRFDWTPVPGVDSYALYRGNDADLEADESTFFASIASTDSTYDDVAVSPGTLYFYRVRAVADGHEGPASAPAAGRTMPFADGYLTGAYYYPWYGPMEGGHSWENASLRERLVPKQPPELGFYSSRDPEVIRRHLEWMAAYGVDFIVCSWWGQDSWEDVTLRDYILPEIAKTSIKFSVYYESPLLNADDNGFPMDATRRARLKNDYGYLADTYFSNPNYLQVDDAPVVFIYLSRLYYGDVKGTFDEVRSVVDGKGYGLFLIGDDLSWGKTSVDHMQFLDAVSPYIALDPIPRPGHLAETDYFGNLSVQSVEWEAAAHSVGKLFVPNVFPGFNNSSGPISPRRIRSGASSTSMLENMIRLSRPFVDPDKRMIMITSWNEWHEDTQIEPTVEAPPTRLDDSGSGREYTDGYAYEGYGMKPLEVVADLLAPELPGTMAGVWLDEPPAGASDVPAYASFSWNGRDDADRYHLQIDTDSNFPAPVINDSTLSETAYTSATPLDYATTFYWRVRAEVASNGKAGKATTFGPWSETRSFTVAIGTSTEDESTPPTKFALYRNYPNPFNPSTTFRYDIPKTMHVRLAVYDALGRMTAELVDRQVPSGSYRVTWHAEKYGSGMYFYRLEAGDFVQTRAMFLVK